MAKYDRRAAFEKRRARRNIKNNALSVVLLVTLIGLMYAIVYSM